MFYLCPFKVYYTDMLYGIGLMISHFTFLSFFFSELCKGTNEWNLIIKMVTVHIKQYNNNNKTERTQNLFSRRFNRKNGFMVLQSIISFWIYFYTVSCRGRPTDDDALYVFNKKYGFQKCYSFQLRCVVKVMLWTWTWKHRKRLFDFYSNRHLCWRKMCRCRLFNKIWKP